MEPLLCEGPHSLPGLQQPPAPGLHCPHHGGVCWSDGGASSTQELPTKTPQAVCLLVLYRHLSCLCQLRHFLESVLLRKGHNQHFSKPTNEILEVNTCNVMMTLLVVGSQQAA